MGGNQIVTEPVEKQIEHPSKQAQENREHVWKTLRSRQPRLASALEHMITTMKEEA